MPRSSAIDTIDSGIKQQLEAKLRCGISLPAASAWLNSEGIHVTEKQVRTYYKKEKGRISAARDVAELKIQEHKIAKAEGINIGLDFIDRLDCLYDQGLQMVTPELFASMRPIDILNASNRYAAVKIQAEKFRQEMRDRINVELKALRLEPDINEETLDKIEQRIYGVY